MNRFALLSMLMLGLVSTGIAAPITVNNFSFETFNPLNLVCNGIGCVFNLAAIPGWTNNSVSSGSWRPGNPANTDYFDFIPDGSMIAYANGSAIEQTVGATVVPGTTYTLTVAVGNRKDLIPAANIALIIGGALSVLGTGTTAVEGGWSEYTAVYVGQAAQAGQSIGIRLGISGPGDQANFDNVRLDAAPAIGIPEPSSALLFGVGLGALASARLRRKRN